jgi:hypothetical protein
MSKKQSQSRSPVAALRVVTDAPADENTATMIEMLQEHLKLVREGKMRSLALCRSLRMGRRLARSGPARTATAPVSSASSPSHPRPDGSQRVENSARRASFYPCSRASASRLGQRVDRTSCPSGVRGHSSGERWQ